MKMSHGVRPLIGAYAGLHPIYRPRPLLDMAAFGTSEISQHPVSIGLVTPSLNFGRFCAELSTAYLDSHPQDSAT
jgi:hypothetical protein